MKRRMEKDSKRNRESKRNQIKIAITGIRKRDTSRQRNREKQRKQGREEIRQTNREREKQQGREMKKA